MSADNITVTAENVLKKLQGLSLNLKAEKGEDIPNTFHLTRIFNKIYLCLREAMRIIRNVAALEIVDTGRQSTTNGWTERNDSCHHGSLTITVENIAMMADILLAKLNILNSNVKKVRGGIPDAFQLVRIYNTIHFSLRETLGILQNVTAVYEDPRRLMWKTKSNQE